jgi:hypothetical protein
VGGAQKPATVSNKTPLKIVYPKGDMSIATAHELTSKGAQVDIRETPQGKEYLYTWHNGKPAPSGTSTKPKSDEG